jgi:hypothetical protein
MNARSSAQRRKDAASSAHPTRSGRAGVLTITVAVHEDGGVWFRSPTGNWSSPNHQSAADNFRLMLDQVVDDLTAELEA